jgi:hypothetical protein
VEGFERGGISQNELRLVENLLASPTRSLRLAFSQTYVKIKSSTPPDPSFFLRRTTSIASLVPQSEPKGRTIVQESRPYVKRRYGCERDNSDDDLFNFDAAIKGAAFNTEEVGMLDIAAESVMADIGIEGETGHGM